LSPPLRAGYIKRFALQQGKKLPRLHSNIRGKTEKESKRFRVRRGKGHCKREKPIKRGTRHGGKKIPTPAKILEKRELCGCDVGIKFV